MRLHDIHAGPVSRQARARLEVETNGPGFVDITGPACEAVARSGVTDGLLVLFCRHTSASLTIQENADPDVIADLLDVLDGLAPRSAPYRHASEGADDMPAHIRSMLTGASLAVPIRDGRPALGTWQGIYLVEHRDRPHRREVLLVVQGA